MLEGTLWIRYNNSTKLPITDQRRSLIRFKQTTMYMEIEKQDNRHLRRLCNGRRITTQNFENKETTERKVIQHI